MPAAEYGIASNTYKFYSVGIDAAGREEPMHATYDVSRQAAYSEPAATSLALSSITVENGAAERSFIRYIDLNFNDATNGVLQAIVDSVNNNTNPELTLTQYDLSDSTVIGTVSLQHMLSVVDNAIEIDFGTGGIEGDAGTNGADGYYALSFTPPTGRGIGSTHDFYRLLGDVNGDGSVDANDLAAIAAARGQSVAQIATAIGQPASGLTPLSMDVNGDGTINTIDVALATAAKNRGNSLKKGLTLG
jgi:hypothetical protein